MKSLRTNIYKRRHRSGRETWMVRWKDPVSGMWIARTAGKSEEEALLVEAKVRQDLAMEKEPFPERLAIGEALTVATTVELFLESVKFLSSDPSWQFDTRHRLNKDVLPQLGKVKFSDLKAERVLKFYLYLKKERDLTHASIQKYHSLMSSLGDVFADHEGKGENPIRGLRNFKKYFPNQAPCRAINFLTTEELTLLCEEARKSKCALLYPFIKFLGNSGLRCSEAKALKWNDIDDQGGFICIRDSKNGAARMVPLESDCREVLKLLDQRRQLVFSRPNGLPISDRYMLKLLKPTALAAGIQKRVDLHTLRHSYGSNKLRLGWGLKKVSMLLGHKDIKITSRVYMHLLDGDLKTRDEFLFDNKAPSANDEKLREPEMAAMLSKFISEMIGQPEAALRAGLEQAIPQIRPLLTQTRIHSPSQGTIQNDSTTTSETTRFVTPVLRSSKLIEGKADAKSTPKKQKAQDITALSLRENWRLHGDSNPGLRRERASS